MLGLSNRITLYVIAGLVAILALSWGIHSYNSAIEAKADLRATTETVQKAVETRKADLKADVQTKQKRRVAVDSVRTSGIPVENRIAESPAPAADPEFERLLNDEIDAANSVIDSARGVSN